MFAYDVKAVPESIKGLLIRYDHVVVVGLGGSVLPLKAFVDAYGLSESIFFLDTVDVSLWTKLSKIPKTLFCVASKSGETLEIKALLSELVLAGKLNDTLVVTDRDKGWLRGWATEKKLPTLEIPSDIGGRFTNFTIFHRALLERFGIHFDGLLSRAQEVCVQLKKDPRILEKLYQQSFGGNRSKLILWLYGERLLGLGQWIQQAIAESLGKISTEGRRVGIMPIVLRGPQDQHSVLQLLRDGPQDAALWFFWTSQKKKLSPRDRSQLVNGLETFQRIGLQDAMDILVRSTYQSFAERLADPDLAQPISRFELTENTADIAEIIALIQAFVEYAGNKLRISPFDQPGVERGKQIARDLIAETMRVMDSVGADS